MNNLRDTISKVLLEHGHLINEPSSLDPRESLYDAGLSSHASVSVMLALEDEFDIEFPDALLNRSTFESIQSLEDALTQVLGSED